MAFINIAQDNDLTLLIAGENLAANDLVFLATPFTDLTAGRVYKTTNTDIYKSTKSWVIGFVKTSVSTAATATIQQSGILPGFSGMTVGKTQYLGVDGGLTEVPPRNSMIVGIAVSATELLIALSTEVENVLSWYPKGYVMGGSTGASVATADKIIFSTDTTVAQTSGNLTTIRQFSAGVSADTKGYAMGGDTGASVATADKIIYSTDTTVAQTSGNLSVARNSAAGVSGYNQANSPVSVLEP